MRSSARRSSVRCSSSTSLLGLRPQGYRAPCAELTTETLALLLEHGFRYDSSCMGDDRPYREECAAGSILELPMHWSLDDYPYFMFTPDGGGQLRNPTDVFEILGRQELRLAIEERRHVTYVVHPEVTGRGLQAVAFEQFVASVASDPELWVARHGEVAAHVDEAVQPPVSQRR